MLPKSINLKLNTIKLEIQSDSGAMNPDLSKSYNVKKKEKTPFGKATRPLPYHDNNLIMKAIQETLLNGFLIMYHKSTPLQICNP